MGTVAPAAWSVGWRNQPVIFQGLIARVRMARQLEHGEKNLITVQFQVGRSVFFLDLILLVTSRKLPLSLLVRNTGCWGLLSLHCSCCRQVGRRLVFIISQPCLLFSSKKTCKNKP